MEIKNFLLFSFSLILSFFFTPLMRKICLKFGFLDLPGKRKIHTQPIPRLGGIAVIAAFLITLLFVFIIDASFKKVFYPKIIGLGIATLLIILAGLWDDIWEIKARIKFFTQAIAALVLFYSGLRIAVFTNPFAGGEMHLPFPVSLFLTVFWIVGIINAINLIDGLDGLASGIVFISGLFFFHANSFCCGGLYLDLRPCRSLMMCCAQCVGYR